MKKTSKWFLFLIILCGTFKGVEAQYPDFYQDYRELPDGQGLQLTEWQTCKKAVNVSWGNTDNRYPLRKIPALEKETLLWHGTAWKGERVNLQALIWTTRHLGNVRFSLSPLVSAAGQEIPASALQAGFVRYVMTDELNKNKQGTCGHRPDRTLFDSTLVADVIDVQNSQEIRARETRPLWLTIRVPVSVKPGVYRGKIELNSSETSLPSLHIELKIVNRELPAPEHRRFYLDLWQNPFAVARFHKVPLWSEAHLAAMRPVMQLLAEAGQKTVTASIMHKPWGGQTEDYFESMILRIKRLDGSWFYDYAVFDKWVEFMKNLGIDGQINCYTLIPWDLSFQYFDQASNSLRTVRAEVGTPDYKAYWHPFLVDFARHLKEKGWFAHTTIAMDERPLEAMQAAIRVIRDADPAYKIALAGNFHAELEPDIWDYSIASGQFFPENTLRKRQTEGKKSTYYTCCVESYPNTFTFSPPAEATWLGWYAAAQNFDGYLRWAYNSWTADPLRDSRFRAFGGGDCYLAYPGGRSSIRLEKLIEGIQDYEKIQVLREKFTTENNTYRLKKLNKILEAFELEKLDSVSAAAMIREARKALDKF